MYTRTRSRSPAHHLLSVCTCPQALNQPDSAAVHQLLPRPDSDAGSVAAVTLSPPLYALRVGTPSTPDPCFATLTGHQNWVTDVCVSPHGGLLLSRWGHTPADRVRALIPSVALWAGGALHHPPPCRPSRLLPATSFPRRGC